MKSLVINALESWLDRLKADNSNLTEQECVEALNLMAKFNESKIVIEETDPTLYSKESAARKLGISRATFDRKVAEGKIKEGTKLMGITSKIYTQKDIDEAKASIRKHK